MSSPAVVVKRLSTPRLVSNSQTSESVAPRRKTATRSPSGDGVGPTGCASSGSPSRSISRPLRSTRDELSLSPARAGAECDGPAAGRDGDVVAGIAHDAVRQRRGAAAHRELRRYRTAGRRACRCGRRADAPPCRRRAHRHRTDGSPPIRRADRRRRRGRPGCRRRSRGSGGHRAGSAERRARRVRRRMQSPLVGGAPSDDVRKIGLAGVGANRMCPSAFHEPPTPTVAFASGRTSPASTSSRRR